jgi:hypothetical protein
MALRPRLSAGLLVSDVDKNEYISLVMEFKGIKSSWVLKFVTSP